jgi:CDP-diacylglycerol--glycerol-3-phosphate 3-phosphatidyltransferase
MLAAISDAVDGFVARKFNQFSKLGRILDPIADKGLLLAAVLTMSFSQWHYALPLWFVVLVVSRDVLILGGCALLQHLTGHLEVRPTFLGKACTASQMILVTLFLLQSRNAPPLLYDFPVWIAGTLTVLSGLDYIRLGMGKLREHGHTAPERPHQS